MVEMCVMMPIKKGQVRKLRELGRIVSGPRSEEYRASNRKQKVRKEMWFLQKTSTGHVLISFFDSESPSKAQGTFLKSNDPFDVWEREQLTAITGVDLHNLGELPENIMTIIC